MVVGDFITGFWNNAIDFLIGQNTLQDYLIFFGLFVAIFLGFLFIDKIGMKILKKAAKRTKTSWDDYAIGFLSNISWLFYAYVSLFLSAQILTLDDIVEQVLIFLLIAFIGYYIGRGISGIVDILIEKKVNEKKEKNNIENISMIYILGLFAKIGIWFLILLMILTNIGVEVTPLIAGLGVGGIAVAFALQSILGDLFSAFVIYFDKPFKEGDFIIVGGDMGVVKKIGIKTTRIAALQGQELVVSNSELTSSRINNYKKMKKRRVVFSFGVTYNTPVRKLKKIKGMVEKILSDSNKNFKKKPNSIELDRVHFSKFGDSSLDYEVVYYVPSGDYNEFMDIQEFINLSLVEVFEKEKIEFAFPTRTIYMEK
jgi:small-conductance mechanosensitive channel